MNVSTRNYISLGIMTGTSLDGIDLSIIKSDGINNINFIRGKSYIYSNKLRESIKSILGSKRRDSIINLIEDEYTNFIIKKIKLFLKDRNEKIDLIGFHGQTIIHNPKEKFTWQLGNAKKIFSVFNIPVVYDFRKNDIMHNGNGAPLTPIFHDLLSKKYNLNNTAFINLGGISNLTIKKKGKLIAFDCGPCCYAINEFIKSKKNINYDKNGYFASKGYPNYKIIKNLLEDPYFKKNYPKSLDRLEINFSKLNELTLIDGLATINEFIAENINLALKEFFNIINKVVFLGGGRKNIDLINRIRKKINSKVCVAEELGIDGDLAEASCFAYLAIRSIKNKHISFKTTTGASKNITGGKLINK